MKRTPASHDPNGAQDTLALALARADQLDEAVMAAIAAGQYRPYDGSARISASVSAACVALEHGRALRVLSATGLPTAALSLLRLQHEALTRAVWLLYAASDLAVDKLAAPLSKEAEAAANKLPMMADMLKQLAGKPAAAQPLLGLLAFKDNNSAALNSLVHGGIHALQRHAQGFPLPLVLQAIRNCNGLMLMTGMMLAVLAGSQPLVGRVGRLQAAFADDLPPPLPMPGRDATAPAPQDPKNPQS